MHTSNYAGTAVDKMAKVMGEFKAKTLRSGSGLGSKLGPKVRSKKQAVAIGLSKHRKTMSSLASVPLSGVSKVGRVRKGI